ncbi:Hypothetical predicted protein, partial [Paramuricea clavata]
MKKQQSEMDVKFKALNFRLKCCNKVLGNEDRAAVDRPRKSDERIEQWSTEIENQIVLSDKCMQKLADFVKTIDQRAKEVELKHTQEKTMQFEKQLLEQKLEAALKETKIAEKTVKLPKLSITRSSLLSSTPTPTHGLANQKELLKATTINITIP